TTPLTRSVMYAGLLTFASSIAPGFETLRKSLQPANADTAILAPATATSRLMFCLRMLAASVGKIDGRGETASHWHGVDVAVGKSSGHGGDTTVRVHLGVRARVLAPDAEVVARQRHGRARGVHTRRDSARHFVRHREVPQLQKVGLEDVD